MDHSLIRFILTRAETGTQEVLEATEILEAMETGSLNIDAAIRADPYLVAGFLKHHGRLRRQSYKALPPLPLRQAQCRLLQHMMDLGASPWQQDGEDTLEGFKGAVASANPDLVRMLINHPHCPTDLIDKMLDSMQWAVFNNRFPEMLQVLFDAGLDPHVRKQTSQNTLLHETDSADVAMFLLQAGLDPAAVNGAGQDVPTWWDARPNRTVEGRKALDDVLASHQPVNPHEFLATLGKQWIKVGSTVTKARIKSTLNVDPSSIMHHGMSLPEMVIAQVIGHELKYKGAEVAHRKLRRKILSSMAYCGITTPDHIVPGSNLHTALGIFRQADLGMMVKVNPAPPRNTNRLLRRPPSKPVTKDEHEKVMTDFLHLKPGTSIDVNPSAAIDWIENAASAGVLDRAGPALLQQLLFNPRLRDSKSYAQGSGNLARCLVCLARSQMDQTASQYDPISRQVMESAHRWLDTLDTSSTQKLLSRPQVFPSFLVLLARANRLPSNPFNDLTVGRLREMMKTHTQDHGSNIDPHDEMTTKAAADLKVSMVPENAELGRLLDASIQASLMRERTAAAPASKAAPRL